MGNGVAEPVKDHRENGLGSSDGGSTEEEKKIKEKEAFEEAAEVKASDANGVRDSR